VTTKWFGAFNAESDHRLPGRLLRGWQDRESRPDRVEAPAAPICPPFGLKWLEQIADDHLMDHLPQPRPNGSMLLRLKPLSLIEHLAA
jgi:hypothetical protein